MSTWAETTNFVDWAAVINLIVFGNKISAHHWLRLSPTLGDLQAFQCVLTQSCMICSHIHLVAEPNLGFLSCTSLIRFENAHNHHRHTISPKMITDFTVANVSNLSKSQSCSVFSLTYVVFALGKTVRETNPLRCNLCTITDIVFFFWNRHRREMSFFFTTQ